MIRGITRPNKGFAHIQTQLITANGQLGAIVTKNNGVKAVFCFELAPESGLIKRIYAIMNPEKLQQAVTKLSPELS